MRMDFSVDFDVEGPVEIITHWVTIIDLSPTVCLKEWALHSLQLFYPIIKQEEAIITSSWTTNCKDTVTTYYSTQNMMFSTSSLHLIYWAWYQAVHWTLLTLYFMYPQLTPEVPSVSGMWPLKMKQFRTTDPKVWSMCRLSCEQFPSPIFDFKAVSVHIEV